MKRARNNDDNTFDSSSDNIIGIVNDILANKNQYTVAQCKDKYSKMFPDFAENFPVLFANVCEPNFDIEKFMYMMTMRDNIVNKSTTLEAASKEVGQTLFDKYVKPVIGQNPKN